MNSINSHNPAISVITGDFNGKCSKWYFFDTSDNIGKELDTITLNAGFIYLFILSIDIILSRYSEK